MAVTWKKLVFSDEIADFVSSDDIISIVVLTQAEYDALDPVVATTLYVIVPAEA
jgi:hypothetical protein